MMQARFRGQRLAASVLVSLLISACSDSNDTFQPTPIFSVDPSTIDVSQADVCDIVQPNKCAFPFPSNFFTVEDASAATGRRVNLNPTAIPGTSSGESFDPGEYNRNDGFSPGPLLLLEVPGIDLEQTGAASFTDMSRSLDADAAIQVIDAATGERQLLWAELDSRPAADEARALMIRLARNLQDGGRYIVALQNLVAEDGSTIPSSDAFTVFKEGIPSDIPAFEDRRAGYEDIFAILESNGIPRESLYLAWDFTVASTANITGRMLHIRDQAFTDLGGSAPLATILTADSPDESENADLARRITGTLSVPNFLDTVDGRPGSRFNYDSSDPDALPARFNGNGSVDVDFTCVIPRQALADSSETIAVVIGHGLYGSRESVDEFAPVAEEQNIMFCGMDSWGMSDSDLGVAFASLSNVNNFPQQADRIQQGFLNITLLSEAMRHPDGFASLDAFREGDRSLFQSGAVHYEGVSQGGVLGAALSAINPNFERSALNVAGMRFSLLARRSNAWGAFAFAFDPAYPDPLDKPLMWSVIQMLYDRGENNGYVNHVTSDPLPGSTASRVLIHLAVGDKTVTETAGEILARSMNVPRHLPSVVDGRHVADEPYLNIEGIPAYPWDGSGLAMWDSGPFPIAEHDGTPLQATINNFEPAGYNTHSMTFGQKAARDQKAAFWRTGQVVNVCGETACFGDGYDGTPGEYSPPDSAP
ncbi:MAG: hypothetical protein QNI86_01520 [Halieaceae bacterium]|nr:hypothetical protein [Halieaceae bacterium]